MKLNEPSLLIRRTTIQLLSLLQLLNCSCGAEASDTEKILSHAADRTRDLSDLDSVLTRKLRMTTSSIESGVTIEIFAILISEFDNVASSAVSIAF